MLKRNTSIMIVMALTLCLFTVSCSDADLTKVSTALLDVSNGVAAVQATTEKALDQKLISPETAKSIILVTTRITAADVEATAVLKSITKMTPDARSKIVNILTPLITELDPKQLEFIAGIKNEKLKQEIEGGFATARVALGSIQIILAAHGGT